MELKITKDKVLEAAAKCPQAKETLKTLFPDVFDENKLTIKVDGIHIGEDAAAFVWIGDENPNCLVLHSIVSAEVITKDGFNLIRFTRK